MHAVIVNVTIDRPNSDGGRTEEAYSKVRERSLITAGCPARSRRIFGLSCRFDGQDREIEGRRCARVATSISRSSTMGARRRSACIPTAGTRARRRVSIIPSTR